MIDYTILNEIGFIENLDHSKIKEKIEKYIEILFEWNVSTSLTSNTKEEFFEKHILFSFNYIPFIKDYDNVFDFGSGNGVPGIILSFVFPQKTFLLIENKKRKVAFLEYVSSVLSPNIHIINSSLEKPPEEYLANFCVISKAFNDIDTIRKFFRKSFNLLLPTSNKLNYKNVKIINTYKPKVGNYQNIFFYEVEVKA
ncbi:MAG: 16S rRNA (guanine(527)-N(7))-methyltransferase RsmG [Brevinematales bacterium]|nr:16S rRNA (guanine(527)-N(7))-methyltransferase RsmG [Brevinematales bacterium]